MSEADFSVDQLCDLLGVGRTTTFNRIKELFGMTPNEYIREERLQTAAKMLLEGDKNIAEISLCVDLVTPLISIGVLRLVLVLLLLSMDVNLVPSLSSSST